MTDRITRGEFLIIGTTAAAGLLVGVSCAPADKRGNGATNPAFPDAYLRLEPNGDIVIVVPRPEMGQGVRTAQAMLVADELDVDWSTVRVEQADADEARYGDQYTGGSAVVRGTWQPLRRAGAVARALLIEAAARGWSVPASECTTDRGFVVHGATRRRAPYASLVAVARTLPVPANVTLNSAAARRIIGKETRGVDVPAIVRGAITFGLDVRVPGMLRAVVLRSPVFGGIIKSVDDAQTRAAPGVHSTVRIDTDVLPIYGDDSPRIPNGVAVIAESTWAAMRGRSLLHVEWDARGGEAEGTDAMRAQAVALTRSEPKFIARREGDVMSAFARATRTLDAVYEVPLLAHATMEPMNCTAHVTADRCEIWAPTQNPAQIVEVAMKLTGLARAAVTVHVMRMGGGFGRRFYPDFAAEAIIVSRAVGRPVQVVWSREDDIRHGFYRPAGYHAMRAGLDARGNLIAWSQHLASASRGAFLGWKARSGSDPGVGELEPYDLPASVVPNLQIGFSPITSRISRGQWRAVEPSATVFVTQSFLAEVAQAAGRDPLDFQLELLGRRPSLPYYGSTYPTARLAAVLKMAAERSGWGKPMRRGWGRGIAGSYANSAFVAHAVEVEVAPGGAIRVHRVVSAVDCGTVVNPLGVRAQVEGAVMFALSAALKQQITVERGATVQSNFTDYDALRIDEAPSVEVHIVPSDAPVTGMGEGAVPALAPAVTNAIFAATGTRVRRLPVALPRDSHG